MHTLGQKRPSVPTRKAFCHFIILLKVKAKSSKVKLNMRLSALHTSANGKQEKNTKYVFQSPKVHWANAPETYMIISLASNSSGNLPHPTQQGTLHKAFPWRKCPAPAGQTTCVATSRRSHHWSSEHSISKSLAPVAPPATKKVVCTWNAECGTLHGQEGRQLLKRQLLKQSSPSSVPGVQGLTHLSTEERTVPTRTPGTLHTAPRAMPQMVRTPSMHPGVPTPAEQMDTWRCMWLEQANLD